jgi:dTDP-4-amino-4,6-dideoxygalactose transaminase
LTFVATANAIAHLGGHPVFVDVDRDTMGLSPDALEKWLKKNAEVRDIEKGISDSQAYNKTTNRRIAAILPMHTFGHPCRIAGIMDIAKKWSIPVVEDAAEAIGSYYKGKHCGTFGDVGILSFNGNKTITCGGGGAILTNDAERGARAKHLTTTAKIPHPWEYEHDEIAYNFRMPNLNAALACAQLERLPEILIKKRELAQEYVRFFRDIPWATFLEEPADTRSNYWLCAIALENAGARDAFLETMNVAGVMTRPIWRLMTELSIYKNCQTGSLDNATWLRERVVNLPSGVRSRE